MAGSLEQSLAHPWCIHWAIDSLLWPRCQVGLSQALMTLAEMAQRLCLAVSLSLPTLED